MGLFGAVKRSYDRVDGWARNLSRTRYAVLVGVVGFSSYVAVGALLGQPSIFGALGLGGTLAALHFLFDTNARTS
jgi:hypothetical protein